MRLNGRLWRLLAALFAFTLLVAACGDDDGGDDDEGAGDTTEGDEEEPAEGSGADGVLTFGGLLPETGSLAVLGPPEIAGLELAVQEINEAGGVLGADVEYLPGDSGDTTTDIASQTVERHLSAGADAIIGAASSSVSETVIDAITDANVIQFSPANTSPTFTDYDDNGLYFRTAPSDVLQGRVLADALIDDGAESVALMALDDPYGTGLLGFTRDSLEESGVEVTNEIVYDPTAENFSAEVEEVATADPDGIVVIGFDESAQILTGLVEAGIGPGDKIIYGTDGNCDGSVFESLPAGSMEGFKCTTPQVELTQDFRDRLNEVDPDLGTNTLYAGETYDAVIITALAAEVAGTDEATAVAAEINDVTREGTKCTSFAECRDLIAEGEDVDYDGAGGPYTFIDAGEPSEASFAVRPFGADNQVDEAAVEYRQAALDT